MLTNEYISRQIAIDASWTVQSADNSGELFYSGQRDDNLSGLKLALSLVDSNQIKLHTLFVRDFGSSKSDDILKDSINLLPTISTLKNFKILYAKIGDLDAKHLAEYLRSCNLETVELGHCEWTSQGLHAILNAILANKTITTLIFSAPTVDGVFQIDSKSCDILAEILQNKAELRHLDLTSCSFKNNENKAGADKNGTIDNPKGEEQNQATPVQHKGAKIAKAVAKNTTLRTLNFDCYGLTEFVDELADMIKQNNGLTEINFGNELSHSDHQYAIALALHKNHNLLKLNSFGPFRNLNLAHIFCSSLERNKIANAKNVLAKLNAQFFPKNKTIPKMDAGDRKEGADKKAMNDRNTGDSNLSSNMSDRKISIEVAKQHCNEILNLCKKLEISWLKDTPKHIAEMQKQANLLLDAIKLMTRSKPTYPTGQHRIRQTPVGQKHLGQKPTRPKTAGHQSKPSKLPAGKSVTTPRNTHKVDAVAPKEKNKVGLIHVKRKLGAKK